MIINKEIHLAPEAGAMIEGHKNPQGIVPISGANRVDNEYQANPESETQVAAEPIAGDAELKGDEKVNPVVETSEGAPSTKLPSTSQRPREESRACDDASTCQVCNQPEPSATKNSKMLCGIIVLVALVDVGTRCLRTKMTKGNNNFINHVEGNSVPTQKTLKNETYFKQHSSR